MQSSVWWAPWNLCENYHVLVRPRASILFPRRLKCWVPNPSLVLQTSNALGPSLLCALSQLFSILCIKVVGSQNGWCIRLLERVNHQGILAQAKEGLLPNLCSRLSSCHRFSQALKKAGANHSFPQSFVSKLGSVS